MTCVCLHVTMCTSHHVHKSPCVQVTMCTSRTRVRTCCSAHAAARVRRRRVPPCIFTEIFRCLETYGSRCTSRRAKQLQEVTPCMRRRLCSVWLPAAQQPVDHAITRDPGSGALQWEHSFLDAAQFKRRSSPRLSNSPTVRVKSDTLVMTKPHTWAVRDVPGTLHHLAVYITEELLNQHPFAGGNVRAIPEAQLRMLSSDL